LAAWASAALGIDTGVGTDGVGIIDGAAGIIDLTAADGAGVVVGIMDFTVVVGIIDLTAADGAGAL